MKDIHFFANPEFIDMKALDQFYSAMKQPFSVKGALMPDVHAGYSLPIGAVVATEGTVVPAWVGYDIGCGMCAVPTTYMREGIEANAPAIFKAIYKGLPVGFNHHKADQEWNHERIKRTAVMDAIFNRNGLKQVGTLGGGNHFIELGYDQDDMVWIIVHSGSRGIGHSTATHYMKKASGDGKAREGHFGFSVNSQDGKDYITDLNFCLEFALENRRQILVNVWKAINPILKGQLDWGAMINRNHNHAELKDGLWIHRKGATHAEEGMLGVVPGNMRDGSFIVRGRGNADSLCSSSHGAGRVMGRAEAKRRLDLGIFKEQMEGITANVTDATLDESPRAYKDIFEVMAQQKELVEVLYHVKPIINIKG